MQASFCFGDRDDLCGRHLGGLANSWCEISVQKSLKWPRTPLRVSGLSHADHFTLVKGDVLRAGIVEETAVTLSDGPAPR